MKKESFADLKVVEVQDIAGVNPGNKEKASVWESACYKSVFNPGPNTVPVFPNRISDILDKIHKNRKAKKLTKAADLDNFSSDCFGNCSNLDEFVNGESFKKIPYRHEHDSLTEEIENLLKVTEYLEEDVKSNGSTSDEEKLEFEDDDDLNETKKVVDDDDSENEDDLNNSLEFPIEIVPPDFDDPERLEEIPEYLQVLFVSFV